MPCEMCEEYSHEFSTSKEEHEKKHLFVTRNATGIPIIRNSYRILGIRYDPKSGEKLYPEHRHIMC